MICPKCKTDNPRHSNYCHHCGTRISKTKGRNFGLFLMVCAVMLSIASYFYYRQLNTHPPNSKFSNPQRTTELSPGADRSTDFYRRSLSSDTNNPGMMQVRVAKVNLLDISGVHIRSLTVAVSANGWLALPVHFCLGAYSWNLNIDRRRNFDIQSGILEDIDDFGVWNVPGIKADDALEIAPWFDDEPLAWVSIVSERSISSIFPSGFTEQANAVKFFDPRFGGEPGVFIQDNRIVGWTFGTDSGEGYLWQGPEENQLVPRIRVDDFYRLTFAGGREEQFVRAYSIQDDLLVEKLASFVSAFYLEPKLVTAETPLKLQSKTVVVELRRMIADLVEQGLAKAAADSFNARALTAAGSGPLLIDVVQAVRDIYGYEYALALFEDARVEMKDPIDTDQERLNRFHAELYENSLDMLLQRGDVDSAWRIFARGSDRFPENPRIHLAGVLLALEGQDWSTAESLLYMRDYPPALMDKVQNLENKITEMKAVEGKIIIRFTPESRQIPVNALLNDAVSQRFMIDTGATIVTIPPATARELGLDLDKPGSLRTAYTAGGAVRAREVVLKSVTLNGWEVSDVRALVLDLPSQPDVGLLGLNYLNHFQMNLDSKQGMLTLEPR